MKFCERHWLALQDAIDARGLGALVCEGEEAARRLLDQQSRQQVTRDNFEPLICAHNAVVANIFANVDHVHADMDVDTSDNACPVCVANELHVKHCDHKDCGLPLENGCDIWIEYAADGAAELAAEIGAIASA